MTALSQRLIQREQQLQSQPPNYDSMLEFLQNFLDHSKCADVSEILDFIVNTFVDGSSSSSPSSASILDNLVVVVDTKEVQYSSHFFSMAAALILFLGARSFSSLRQSNDGINDDDGVNDDHDDNDGGNERICGERSTKNLSLTELNAGDVSTLLRRKLGSSKSQQLSTSSNASATPSLGRTAKVTLDSSPLIGSSSPSVLKTPGRILRLTPRRAEATPTT